MSVAIDFRCTYDNLYNGIEANDIVVIGENVETDAKDGEGKFTFTLTQYSDEDLNDSIESTEVTPLGSSLYFQLAMDNPVSGLAYSLTGEFLNATIRTSNNYLQTVIYVIKV